MAADSDYPIIVVPDDAADSSEAMGTRPKIWYRDGTDWSLFKETRQNTGEDWAEKVVAEIAALLGLPHAKYDLAVWRGRLGVVSPKFVPPRGALIHGNELLVSFMSDYPRTGRGSRSFVRVPQHTVVAVAEVVRSLATGGAIAYPIGITPRGSVDTLCGYLMLDALVSNTDRHHENWGIVAEWPKDPGEAAKVYLAPTFDHSSSLGCHETDAARERRLNGRDRNDNVAAFVRRARTPFYDAQAPPNQLNPLDVFRSIADLAPDAAAWWIARLIGLGDNRIVSVMDRIPSSRISSAEGRFACEILRENFRRLTLPTEVDR